MNWLSLAVSVYADTMLDVPVSGTFNFVSRQGNKLYLDGQVYRFASYNVPNLLLIESRMLFGMPICINPVPNPTFDPNGWGYGTENKVPCVISPNGQTDSLGWTIPTNLEIEDAIKAVRGSNGKVIRTYTLGFGPKQHVTGINTYHEPAWVAFDNVLALSKKHGIRLIIPLFNNHWSGPTDDPSMFGDFAAFCKFRGLNAIDFYTSPTLRADVKNLLTYILNRKNSVTGVIYKDDPTILAWETGNELGGWTGTPPPSDWTIEIANYIKSIAPKTLVMDGTFGAYDVVNRYPYASLQNSNIDIFSNHYYSGNDDLARISKDAAHVADNNNKVFVLGEFGFEFGLITNIYSQALKDARISGSLVWSLRAHSRDGGFYIHSENDVTWSYHVPGFPAANTGFGADDFKMAALIRKYGLLTDGIIESAIAWPVPGKGAAIIDPLINPSNLKWFGSAWAASYMVFIKSNSGEYANRWQLRSSFVSDGVKSGKTIFADSSAPIGATVSYLIQPVGPGGGMHTDAAFEIGPFST